MRTFSQHFLTFFTIGKSVLKVEWGVGKYFATVGTHETLRAEVGAHGFQAVLNTEDQVEVSNPPRLWSLSDERFSFKNLSVCLLFTFLAFYILIGLTRNFAYKSSLRYSGGWRKLADKQMTNSTAPDILTLTPSLPPSRPRAETKIKMILKSEYRAGNFHILYHF